MIRHVRSGVKIEELCVGEESQFRIKEVLVLLLDGLVTGRGEGVQLVQILGEIGGTTPVEVGHGSVERNGVRPEESNVNSRSSDADEQRHERERSAKERKRFKD